MRRFNTSGPCDPDKHYTVMRESLVAKGQVLVDQGRYFTIFAPRQAGKTTYFQLLFRQLIQRGYLSIWISFESLKTVSRPRFYQTVDYLLKRELVDYDLDVDFAIEDHIDVQRFFDHLHRQGKRMVLVIDEFEDLPDDVVSEVMHAFRALYQKQERHALHALILVGVSSLAELVVSSASPFNVVDQLQIPYFTFSEVEALIGQYVTESGQPFEPQVIKAIYDNTQGQPGLVCGLCEYLVEEMVPDRSQPISMAVFYPTLKHFLIERFDKNILNIVHKAKQKQDFMIRALFDDAPIPFSVDDPNIAFLHAHGVIENVNNFVEIPVPLYSKRLIAAFRPLINGETEHYVSAYDTFQAYLTPDGLNIHAILTKYNDYVRRRGFRAFDTEKLKEAAWHYSLDGFINFFIERLGGQTFIEVPTGRGRTDILILHRQQKYVIETKVFTDQYTFQRGKRQLAVYLASEGLEEGFYVVFSHKHKADDTLYFEEVVDDKRIYTYLILTNFEPPSRRA